METVKEISGIYRISQKLRQGGHVLGFVPTMGYLHEGHASLIERSVRECSKTIVSIFVNPAQFGPGEDYEKYPRDFERDFNILQRVNADYAFVPAASKMYRDGHKTSVKVKMLEKIMCGKFRPAHFSGVCTVVLKLFNIVNPHRAYFGEKDYQQLVVIKQMVKDLNIPVEIIGCPTVRETDGLAFSSRNRYLSKEERRNATILFESLNYAAELIKKGQLGLKAIRKKTIENILNNKSVKGIDYIDFRNPENLDEIKDPEGFRQNTGHSKILIAAAIWIGTTRLIDNIVI